MGTKGNLNNKLVSESPDENDNNDFDDPQNGYDSQQS
jgi:hypothetical protein